jgi:hypothetical protein
MKAPFLVTVAVVAITLTATAQNGPISPLYLTFTGGNLGPDIYVVQGNNVINTFPAAYNSVPAYEIPIAVYGDVRTTGWSSSYPLGGQYTLGGTPTGTSYVLPSVISSGGAFDSTTDGAHNYLVDYYTGIVYQTARDFTNAVPLFTVGFENEGITYDPFNHSLWISGYGVDTMVTDYSLNGTVLSSFSTGHADNAALALDPADHTLWLVNNQGTDRLEQYSTTGTLLNVGPFVGYNLGGEFNMTPEPGTLVMFGSGVLGLAGLLRRKLNF